MQLRTTRDISIVLPNNRMVVVILPMEMNEDELKYFIACLNLQKSGICNQELGLAMCAREEGE